MGRKPTLKMDKSFKKIRGGGSRHHRIGPLVIEDAIEHGQRMGSRRTTREHIMTITANDLYQHSPPLLDEMFDINKDIDFVNQPPALMDAFQFPRLAKRQHSSLETERHLQQHDDSHQETCSQQMNKVHATFKPNTSFCELPSKLELAFSRLRIDVQRRALNREIAFNIHGRSHLDTTLHYFSDALDTTCSADEMKLAAAMLETRQMELLLSDDMLTILQEAVDYATRIYAQFPADSEIDRDKFYAYWRLATCIVFESKLQRLIKSDLRMTAKNRSVLPLPIWDKENSKTVPILRAPGKRLPRATPTDSVVGENETGVMRGGHEPIHYGNVGSWKNILKTSIRRGIRGWETVERSCKEAKAAETEQEAAFWNQARKWRRQWSIPSPVLGDICR